MKRVRSQFKYDNEASNIGHIVASEHNNHYPSQTEIKLLVHPLTSKNLPEDLNFDASKNLSELFSDTITINPVIDVDGQIAGYGPPVVFTCDSKYLIKSLDMVMNSLLMQYELYALGNISCSRFTRVALLRTTRLYTLFHEPPHFHTEFKAKLKELISCESRQHTTRVTVLTRQCVLVFLFTILVQACSTYTGYVMVSERNS